MPIGRKRVAYRKMIEGLVFLGAFVTQYGSYNFSRALEPGFAAKPLLVRIALFQFFGIFERCKYYAIWTLTEGAAILTGLGFTGYSASGASQWDGAANISVWHIEFGENFKVSLWLWSGVRMCKLMEGRR
jgi:lysophospholipid acyltransferase